MLHTTNQFYNDGEFMSLNGVYMWYVLGDCSDGIIIIVMMQCSAFTNINGMRMMLTMFHGEYSWYFIVKIGDIQGPQGNKASLRDPAISCHLKVSNTPKTSRFGHKFPRKFQPEKRGKS